MYYFLVARPLHPPLPVSGWATKKRPFFAASLTQALTGRNELQRVKLQLSLDAHNLRTVKPSDKETLGGSLVMQFI